MSIKSYVTNQEDFRKVLDENPTLPVMFLVKEDCCPEEDGYMSCCIGSATVEELCEYNDKILNPSQFDAEIEYVLDNRLDDEVSDEEYDKAYEEEEKSVEFIKCIAIRIAN